MLFTLWTSESQRNHVLDGGGPDISTEEQILGTLFTSIHQAMNAFSLRSRRT